MTNRKRGYLLILAAAVLYSTTEVVLKGLGDTFAPMQVTVERVLIGAVALLPFALKDLKKRNIRLTRSDYGYFALMGFLTVLLHMSLLQMAGAKRVGHKDGCGTICCTDDCNRSSILQVEEETCQEQRKKNAELSRCSKKHQPRFFQQRPEVDHGTNADEEQQRKQLVGHSRFKQSRDGALRIALCDCTGKRQVHQHCAKAHGQKQARFHLLCDCKVDEQRTDPPHHDHLPGQISKIGKETVECIPEIHVRSLPPYDPVAAARKKTPATAPCL